MDRILSGGKGAEMIPFDLGAPVFFFPVRHHSPVCSYHLIGLIEMYEPDIILIEGPENADRLLPVITAEDTVLPAAIYCYYKDTKKLISEDAGDYKCYYPFQYSSPEYNAALEAKSRGIPARFIDLPYSEILINTSAGNGLLRDGEKHSYTDDSRLMRGKFYRSVCEKTGVRDFEEFWEKYFEIGGLHLSTEKFTAQMNTYCTLIRADSTEEELSADGTQCREAYMAANILDAMKSYKKVLVVTGGFHTSGLYKLVQSGNVTAPKLHKIAEKDMGSYPMAYSYRAADSLRGYASGMKYPAFYDGIMKELREKNDPETVYNSWTFSLLTATAKKANKSDIPVTISDMTAAYSMMTGLAALRGIRQCGMSEVMDAVTACFIKGEKTVSSSLPLDIAAQIATGEWVGHIGDKSHIPPLIADFEAQCDTLGIKYKLAVPTKAEAALFTAKKGLDLSRFFHRMDFLQTGFARLLKGPDIRNNRDRSRVREEWQYRRSPEVDAVLIDHTTDGSTIAEACAALGERLLKQHRRCAAAASIAVDFFLMGIPVQQEIQSAIDDILTDDGDFFSVGSGLRSFETLCGLRELYGSRDDSTEKNLARCFDRLIAALPSMAGVAAERSDEVIDIMKIMYAIAEKDGERRDHLISALLAVTAAEKREPAVHGAAMGALCALDSRYRADAEKGAKGYLSGSTEIRKKGAEYLRGLFSTARDIVFTESTFLEMTDELIGGLEYEDFLEILPSLRLAFSSFTPSELQQAAGSVAVMHGLEKSDLLRKPAVDEALFLFGEKFDRMICEVTGKEVLLNDR